MPRKQSESVGRILTFRSKVARLDPRIDITLIKDDQKKSWSLEAAGPGWVCYDHSDWIPKVSYVPELADALGLKADIEREVRSLLARGWQREQTF